MPELFRYLVLPLALAAAVGLTVASYLTHERRRLRWMSALRLGLVLAVAGLLFFPSWTRRSREVHRPSVAVMLDTSASMQLAETPGGKTRYQRALERLAELRGRLQGEFDIELYGFSRHAEPISGAAPESPAGKETDLAASLAEVLNKQDRERTRAVFVLSDGRSTAAESPLPWARTSPFPIYTLAVGNSDFPYRDLELAGVEAPDRLYKDSMGQLRVRLRGHGLDHGLVSLEQGGHRLEQKPFSTRDQGPVTFDFRPTGGGLTLYTVKVAGQTGELTLANNSWTVPVEIETTPRKVLLVAATPGWDYTFLKRQLRSDPRYEVTDPLHFTRTTPIELPSADLGSYGLVAIAGFRTQAFRPEAVAALADYVKSREGVLLLFGNGRDNLEDLLGSELAPLLPVVRPLSSEEPSTRLPFVPGEKSPLFRILEHPQANQQAWRSLPPILVAQPALSPSAATVVLGTFARYPKDTPAISYRLFGRGMTVLFDTDETYLWKTLMDAVNDPDHLYERFWANLVSWLTDESRLTGVGLTLSRLHYNLGDEVYVRVDDFAGKLETAAREDVVLSYRSDAIQGRLSPERVQGGFLASFTPPAEGRYTLTLTLRGGEEVTREFLVDAVLRDFTNPLADPDTLKELAELSGGRFFAEGTGDLGSLRLDPSPKVEERTESLHWVDRPWALALGLALLAAEWLLRKKYNLV
ncbi:MAG: VWA domain-containing protein [Candidatus Riflebacteria bacterium]|nr:VWA domain-containing protein [Candidatus Riflebacteria bacterium]